MAPTEDEQEKRDKRSDCYSPTDEVIQRPGHGAAYHRIDQSGRRGPLSYRTVDGTATTNYGDYVAKTGTLTFNRGETTQTITIEVKGDSKKEANETFYLDLFGNSSNSQFTKNCDLGTILNDD